MNRDKASQGTKAREKLNEYRSKEWCWFKFYASMTVLLGFSVLIAWGFYFSSHPWIWCTIGFFGALCSVIVGASLVNPAEAKARADFRRENEDPAKVLHP